MIMFVCLHVCFVCLLSQCTHLPMLVYILLVNMLLCMLFWNTIILFKIILLFFLQYSCLFDSVLIFVSIVFLLHFSNADAVSFFI